MNSNQFVMWFGYLASYSVLLPLFFYIRNKENFKIRSLNILAVMIIMGGLTDLAAHLLHFQFHLPNMPLLNIEFVVEFLIITWLFAYFCPPIKLYSLIIVPAFLALFYFTTFYWQNIYSYQSITHVAAAIIILIYAARYYHFMFSRLPKMAIYHYAPFWILIAFYSYYIVNLFLYALSTYFFYDQKGSIGMLFWMTHGFIEIVRNTLFAIGISKTHRPVPLSLYK